MNRGQLSWPFVPRARQAIIVMSLSPRVALVAKMFILYLKPPGFRVSANNIFLKLLEKAYEDRQSIVESIQHNSVETGKPGGKWNQAELRLCERVSRTDHTQGYCTAAQVLFRIYKTSLTTWNFVRTIPQWWRPVLEKIPLGYCSLTTTSNSAFFRNLSVILLAYEKVQISAHTWKVKNCTSHGF